jgi:hypothetical protein
LNFSSRIFLSEEDQPGTITTVSISGGLYISDERDANIADFGFKQIFSATPDKQQFSFNASVSLNGDESDAKYLHFLKDRASLDPTS